MATIPNYDRGVENVGNIIALEHVNVTIPDQRLATLFYVVGIIDPDGGARLFEIEHEVRSLKHPMWGRAFVNRDPGQTQRNYLRGRDAF